jgi:hypothetical protein
MNCFAAGEAVGRFRAGLIGGVAVEDGAIAWAPFIVDVDRNHRLNIKDILRALIRAGVEIRVVLEREAVEIAYGVLQ